MPSVGLSYKLSDLKSYIENTTIGPPGQSVASTGWGADGHRTYPDHSDEREALAETGENGCEALMWAIATLKAAIQWREDDLKKHPEHENTEIGRGHRQRIKILRAKLEQLEQLVWFVCVFNK